MGLIPNEIIDAVLERSDIVATVSRYIQLKKAGRNFKALCPFHQEKSPSFVVNPDKQIFHCFGCGAGGNSIGFVMRYEHLEFPDAVRALADLCSITIPEDKSFAPGPEKQLREEIYRVNDLAAMFFHDTLLTGRDVAAKAARDYLKARGVNLETVKKFRIGFAPDQWDGLNSFLKSKNISDELMAHAGLIIARDGKRGFYDRFRNRVMFPIFDINARPIAFGARALGNEEGAKYINSPETPVYTKGRHLYGFYMTKTAAGNADQVIVVEGYMDMIMPFVHGVENIAASLGTALTTDQIRLIRRYTPNVLMLFDTDAAGQNAILRSLDLLIDCGMNVRVVTLSKGEDPDSFIRTYGIQAFQERLGKASSLFDFKLSWAKSQHDAHTIEGKARIAQTMLESIARFDNEVVKSELVKKLREDLNIDENAVWKQMLAIKGQSTPDFIKTVKNIQLSLSDEIFLGILLADHKWAHLAQQELTPEDFSHPLMRSIVEQMWQLSAKQDEWSIQDLLKFFKDETSQELITRLLSKDEAWLGDQRQVFKDCVTKMQKKRLEMQLVDVKRTGDLQAVNELIRLIKK